MKKTIPLIILIVLFVGCSSAITPAVGDDQIDDGISADVSSENDETSDESVDDQSDENDEDTVASGTGVLQGIVYLEDSTDNSGVTVTINGKTMVTDTEGSYEITDLENGSYLVSFVHDNDCDDSTSLTGHLEYSDGRADKNNTLVVFQYAPQCYHSEQLYNIVIFSGKTTIAEPVTLEIGTPERILTSTDSNGDYVINNVVNGDYIGHNPEQPDDQAGIYEQLIGTYSIAATDGNAIGSYDDGRIDMMEVDDTATFRSDTFIQDFFPMTVGQELAILPTLNLYPIIKTVQTPNLHVVDDYGYAGIDFSNNTDVDPTDLINTDVYTDFSEDILFIKSNITNFKSLGAQTLQDITTAEHIDYINNYEVGNYLDFDQHTDNFNEVYEAQTIEGNFVKFRLLPKGVGCTSTSYPNPDGTHRFLIYDVLYYLQTDGSETFDY